MLFRNQLNPTFSPLIPSRKPIKIVSNYNLVALIFEIARSQCSLKAIRSTKHVIQMAFSC